MDESDQTFDYGSRPLAFLSFLLFAAVAVFIGFGAAASLSGDATFNERPAVGVEKTYGALIFVLVGSPWLWIFGHSGFRFLNERIVFRVGQVAWVDAFGKKRVHCRVQDILGIDCRSVLVNNLVRYEVETTQGTIRFLNTINRRSELEARVRRLLGGVDAPVPARPFRELVWNGRTEYRYRNPMLAFFGLVFLGFIGFMFTSLITGTVGTGGAPVWPFFVVGLLFLLVPYHFLGAILFERIRIVDGHIVWVNRHGRTQVRARLDEVESIDVQRAEASLAKVYTKRGEIRFSSYIGDFEGLVRALQRLTGVSD